MFVFRKLGSVLRGKVTPRQVLLATTFGGLLGFVPGFFLPGDVGSGFAQAPGLILLLLALVLVVNANLAVFGLVTLAGKALSLALLPVSYRIGVWLLDGPLQGLFRSLVNGKVTAWFGFERYATTGGLVLGLVFGVVTGLVLNRALRAIRTHMADVEENSERYQKYAGKWWVRLLAWAVLGKGKGKKQSWRDLAEQQKKGLPIRIFGVLLVAVAVVSLWIFQQWFSTPILTANVRSALEVANGATVDLQAAQLDLAGGKLELKQLAIADSKALGEDLLAADALVATIDTGELMRRRFVIDEITSKSVRTGSPRTRPGVIIPGEQPPPPPPAPPAGTKTIDDYLKDIEVWKQRLEQVRHWVDKIAGGGDSAPAAPTPEQREQDRRDQEATGLARVVATHLLEGGPRVLIRKIDLEGIGYSIGGRHELLDLHLKNVSDRPAVVAEPLSLLVSAQSDALRLGLAAGSSTARDFALDFAMKAVSVDSLFGQLKIGGQSPLQGGTVDLASKGGLKFGAGGALELELPLQATLHDTTFAFAGMKPTKVDNLLVPLGVRGPLTQPTVVFDDQVLQKALLDAGQKELAGFVQQNAGKLLGGLPKDLQGIVDPSKTPEQMVDAAKQKLAEEQKRLEEEAKKKLEDEAKKKLEEQGKKLIPGGLNGLFGGKKEEPKPEPKPEPKK